MFWLLFKRFYKLYDDFHGKALFLVFSDLRFWTIWLVYHCSQYLSCLFHCSLHYMQVSHHSASLTRPLSTLQIPHLPPFQSMCSSPRRGQTLAPWAGQSSSRPTSLRWKSLNWRCTITTLTSSPRSAPGGWTGTHTCILWLPTLLCWSNAG